MATFKHIMQMAAMTIGGIILNIPLLFILLPIIVIFWLFSSILYTLSYVRYKGGTTRARGPDVIHGKEHTLSLPILNIGVRINGQMDLDEIKTKVLRILTSSLDKNGTKRYQRLMDIYGKSFGYYIYRYSPNFSIDDHIKVIDKKDIEWDTLPQNPTWDDIVSRMLNKYGHEGFTQDAAQWEMLFLKENDKRYTGIFRIHHAIADGIYLSRMFCEEFLDKPVKLYTSYVPPSRICRIATCIWSLILLPFGILKVASNVDENPLHGPKLTGTKRFFVTKPISVDDLHKAKTKSGVSFNTILFSVVSYGLENYFKRKSMLIPKVTALTPVPLQNPLKSIKMKNKFAVASLRLPTLFGHEFQDDKSQLQNPHVDQFKRMKKVQKVLNRIKQDPSMLSANSLINTLCYVFPSFIAETLVSSKGCTLCVSNVPGPREELHVWSGIQEEMMFWVPDRTPTGFGVSVMSFNNQLRLGLIIDTGLSPKLEEGKRIIKDFEDEIVNILKTVQSLDSPTPV